MKTYHDKMTLPIQHKRQKYVLIKHTDVGTTLPGLKSQLFDLLAMGPQLASFWFTFLFSEMGK